MTPDPAVIPIGIKQSPLNGMDRMQSILRVRTGSSNAYMLVRGTTTGRMQVGNLGMVYDDGHIGWFLDDSGLSTTIVAAAGLKNPNGIGVLFTDFVVSSDQQYYYLSGYLLDKHADSKNSEPYTAKDFVVKLDAGNMTLVPNFGVKGISFIGGKNYWAKMAGDQTTGPRMQPMSNNRIAVSTRVSTKKTYASDLPIRLTILRPDGSEDAKFREAFNKNTAVTNQLDQNDHLQSFEVFGEDILLTASDAIETRTFVKVNSSGVFDNNFFNFFHDESSNKSCGIVASVHSQNGGWLFFSDCYGQNVWKVTDAGQLDTSFGNNGRADVSQWQQQSDLAFNLKSLSFSYKLATELKDGRLAIPFEWDGQFSKTKQSGFLIVDKRGYLDRSFAMHGVLGGSMASFGFSMYSQQFSLLNGRTPIGIGINGNGSGIVVRRYLP
jgi:hypothetical protein